MYKYPKGPLMEVTRRGTLIRSHFSFYKKRFVRIGVSDLTLRDLRITGNAEFVQERILTEKKCWLRYVIYISFETTCYLPDRRCHFLHRSALLINSFCGRETFDSVCLIYAYQLYELVIAYVKCEDNTSFNPLSVIC